MLSTSRPLVFRADNRELVGILDDPGSNQRRGVLIVTGGPQYRIGSHRQFVLLARAIGNAGYPVFRFDYHGMGDSEGPIADFVTCQTDIKAAAEVFRQESSATEVVIWGLCDAASAGLISVLRGVDPAGLVLVNPWVRSEEGLARSHLRHYYVRYVFSRAFWTRLFAGRMDIRRAVRELLDSVWKVIFPNRRGSAQVNVESGDSAEEDFRWQMREGMRRFNRPVLLILCGEDLTASEFDDYANRDSRWKNLLRRGSVTHKTLAGADHTFSRMEWRDEIAKWTIDWLGTW